MPLKFYWVKGLFYYWAHRHSMEVLILSIWTEYLVFRQVFNFPIEGSDYNNGNCCRPEGSDYNFHVKCPTQILLAN